VDKILKIPIILLKIRYSKPPFSQKFGSASIGGKRRWVSALKVAQGAPFNRCRTSNRIQWPSKERDL
jgi:hypothetical protein